MKRRIRRIGVFATIGITLLTLAYIAGCVRFSGGAWVVKEAPLPEGWPPLTPVGEVLVKEYPLYRAAIVDESRMPGNMAPMFRTLFAHIKRNDIAMTTPVEMGYEQREGSGPSMVSMAFIYREPSWGEIGSDGDVTVRDLNEETMASIGVRGKYSDKRMRENLPVLDAWLAERSDQYRIVGPPRYLGYNGPFTLPFMRYGEVQIPVERLRPAAERSLPDSR